MPDGLYRTPTARLWNSRPQVVRLSMIMVPVCRVELRVELPEGLTNIRSTFIAGDCAPCFQRWPHAGKQNAFSGKT